MDPRVIAHLFALYCSSSRHDFPPQSLSYLFQHEGPPPVLPAADPDAPTLPRVARHVEHEHFLRGDLFSQQM